MTLKETIEIHLDLISPRRAFAYGIVGVLGIRTVLPLGELSQYIGFVIATFFVFALQWCGTNYYNHIHDIRADVINDPKRPLASMRIIESRVRFVMYLWFAISYALILFILKNPITFICALLYTSLAYFYSSPKYKLKHKAWGPIFVITSAILLSLIGGVAVFQYSMISTFKISSGYGLLWIGIIAITAIGASFSKEFKDIKGDIRAGSETYPILWGVEKATKINSILLVLPHLLAVFSYFYYRTYYPRFLYFEIILLTYVLYNIKTFLENPSIKRKGRLFWIRSTNASIGLCVAYILSFINQ